APVQASNYFAPAGEVPKVADMNGDGFADLVTFTQRNPGSGFSPVFMALGSGTGSFGAPILVSPYFAPAGETPAVADLNGDGRADLVTFTQRPAASGFSPVFVAYAQAPGGAGRRASLAAPAP